VRGGRALETRGSAGAVSVGMQVCFDCFDCFDALDPLKPPRCEFKLTWCGSQALLGGGAAGFSAEVRGSVSACMCVVARDNKWRGK
jgi:hypothetical protein